MKTDTIDQTYYIKAPASTVFNAISEPKELAKWFLKSAELDARKGGKYRFTWMFNGYEQEGNVIDFKMDERLVLDWAAAKGSIVTFTVKKEGNGTLLTIVHSRFDHPATMMLSLSGWTYYLTNLKSVLENGKDLRHERDELFGR
jgi:uncharacterized protein YndB with AHSA1/START domain